MVMDRISAFMDGEAGQTETRQTMQRLKQNEECCETWKTFHLIGDIMRGDPPLEDDFMARFHARMEHEPTQLAPRMTWRKSTYHALSAAASVAAVAVVLTVVFTDNPLQPQAPIAAAPKIDAATVAQGVMQPRPVAAANQGKMNEYLMAHQEYSPSTAFQGVVPYVRTVAETHDGSAR
jgi:sigma-E factor negative regulatory protein RseA